MRFVKVAAAATSLLLIGAVTSMGSAGAAANGVGTSKASTTVVGVSLGTDGALLDLRLLGDDAQSTIDTKTAATPEAFSKLTALRLKSSLVNDPTTSEPLDLTLSALESRQPGGQAEVTQSSLDLANPGISVLPGLGDIVSGNLNLAKLTSFAEGTTAKSSLTGSLTNTKVAGALLDAQAVSNTLGSESSSSQSTSTRAVDVDAITVLDLGALLSGLGINLTDLTPDELDGLLGELGVDLSNLDPATTLSDLIDAVQAQIDDVVANGIAGTDTVGGIVDELGLGDVIPDTEVDAIAGVVDAADQVQALVDALQAALVDVLNTALSALDAAPLLKLDGVNAGVVATATDTVDGSVADVTAEIGAITVGALSLPGIDLLDTADTVNGVVEDVNTAISGVLDVIGVEGLPVSLEDLVDIEVLKKTEDVSKVGDYVTATAGITALTATITPPVDLDELVEAILARTGPDGSSVASVVAGLEGQLPALSEAMNEFEATLGGGVEALAGGATVRVAEVMGTSEFRSVAPASTDPEPPLAATGANSVRMAGFGFLLMALGLGLAHWFQMPVPAWVRRRD